MAGKNRRIIMGERHGSLISVRPDVKVVDCTLRDGGLVNNFRFTDEFVRDLYLANIKAGVDYMEFGYKASKDIFNEDDFGKWKFCNDADIRKIVGDNKTDLKIAVMADVGRTDFKKDLLPKKESPIDLVRVATYINAIPAAIEIIEDCAKKGYETTINIMAVSKARTEDIIEALEILGQSPVKAFYIVDSYGALYPEESRRLAELYYSIAEKYKKSVGIHAHNNQQLAFANTIEAMTQGVSYLDATVDGMGRGAGNCALELLLGFLKNPKYKVDPILKIIEDHINKLREQGVKWGYDIPYMLTGQYNTHPRPAISFIKDDRKDCSKFAHELFDIINS
jgi:4-hydroxy 2-oxovalerate aldolase